MHNWTLDVELHTPDDTSQAKYLVHGYDDLLWTNNIKDVLLFLKYQIQQIERNKNNERITINKMG